MAKPVFKQYPIAEEIDFVCYFYKSPDKKNPITGRLTYHHNRGIFINLMTPIDFTDNMMLYAESEHFNHFTFYNVRRRGSIDDEMRERDNKFLNADFMLMSAAFPSEDSFDSISFELMELWEWYPDIRLAIKKSKKKIAFSLSVASPVTASIKGKTIIFRNDTLDNATLKGIKIEQTPTVIIKHSAKAPFKDLFSDAEKFRTLFQLLTGGYGAFTEIFLYDGKVGYRAYFVDENSEKSLKWGASSIYLKFSDIKRSLEKIIRNWDTLHIEIRQVIDILIMEYNNYSMSSEVRFLNVARAIETFHRKRRSSDKKDEALAKVVKDVQKKIPQKYKEKFANSLNFIHEQTLRDRLGELYNELKDETKLKLELDEDWIAYFVKSRNYYTHFGTMNNKVLKGDDLRELSNRVRALLYVLVAKELGINEKILAKELWHLILV
jgi:hypothetical protein